MATALQEQQAIPAIQSLSFEERLGLLVDRELTARENRRLHTRLRQAKLKQSACLEDLDQHTPRGLDLALITQLATGTWIREGLNCLILGPTGVGKTWIACALAHQACRQGFSTRYLRVPRLFEEWRLAHADGGFPTLMRSLAHTDLLLLDDWGLSSLDAEARRDLLELLETATASAPRSLPASCPSRMGMSSSVIPPWPTPSSTGWCTTRITSPSKGSPCASAMPVSRQPRRRREAEARRCRRTRRRAA